MYTEGKWKASKNYMGTWTISTDDAHIADVDRHFNAHLIAAAPIMHQELLETLNFLNGIIGIIGHTASVHDFEERREAIRTTLTKAEGK